MALRHLELKDPTVNEIEIRTAAERAAGVQNRTPAEPTMTLGQVESLLRAATEYAKAQRPIVLHTSSAVAPSVDSAEGSANLAQASAPPRHPGVDITIPPSVGWAPIRHRVPQRPGWGVRLACASMATTLVSAAAAGATNGNPGTVAAVAAGVLGTVAGIAQAVTEHNREA